MRWDCQSSKTTGRTQQSQTTTPRWDRSRGRPPGQRTERREWTEERWLTAAAGEGRRHSHAVPVAGSVRVQRGMGGRGRGTTGAGGAAKDGVGSMVRAGPGRPWRWRRSPSKPATGWVNGGHTGQEREAWEQLGWRQAHWAKQAKWRRWPQGRWSHSRMPAGVTRWRGRSAARSTKPHGPPSMSRQMEHVCSSGGGSDPYVEVRRPAARKRSRRSETESSGARAPRSRRGGGKGKGLSTKAKTSTRWSV